MRWQCQFYDSKGEQCTEPATLRIHFEKLHPFDHMDLCKVHIEFHPGYVWSQEIIDNGEVLIQ